MDFEQLINERYSCRKFSSKKVEKKLLEKILEAGRVAPTAKNQQPIKIYVCESDEALKKIDQVSPCRYNAPVVLAVVYKHDEMWRSPINDGLHSGVEDVAIVATHMMLEAKNVGLDSCWVKNFDNKKFNEAFGLSDNETCVLLLPIGYGEIGPGPMHKQKKDISKLVEYR